MHDLNRQAYIPVNGLDLGEEAAEVDAVELEDLASRACQGPHIFDRWQMGCRCVMLKIKAALYSVLAFERGFTPVDSI